MKRNQKVSYSPYGEFNPKDNPYIRIANRFLAESGFRVGDNIEIEYLADKLITQKIKN